MNVLCTSEYTIGIMGQLISIIDNIETKIEEIGEIKTITINNTKRYINADPFEHIFIRDNSITDYNRINVVNTQEFAYQEVIPLDKMSRYKTIISKLIINPEIIEKFKTIKNELSINETFLGAHVRLSDMNEVHGNLYGYTYFEDFVKQINEAMETNEYSKIFVASDTQEAIAKLKTIYGDTMACHDNFERLYEEYGDITAYSIKNLPTNIKWIQDTFIEMLLLAECGGLIHRVTNFANMAKIYSNTIKKIYFLKGKPAPK